MAKKTEDAFSVNAFDPGKIAGSFRDLAEKGAEQSRTAYARMKTAAEDAGKTVEATVQSVQAGSVDLGLKTIEAVRINTESSLSHLEALLGVKSVAELVELQTAFLRKQAETAMEQARTLQDASRKLAETMRRRTKRTGSRHFARWRNRASSCLLKENRRSSTVSR